MTKILLIPLSCSLYLCCHSFYLYISYNHQIHFCYYFEQIVIWLLKNKKNTNAYFTVTYSFCNAFSLSEFLTYIIFFLFEKLNICCKVGRSIGNKFPQFLFSKKVFTSPSFFKNSFSRFKIEVGGFSPLNAPVQWLLSRFFFFIFAFLQFEYMRKHRVFVVYLFVLFLNNVLSFLDLSMVWH